MDPLLRAIFTGGTLHDIAGLLDRGSDPNARVSRGVDLLIAGLQTSQYWFLDREYRRIRRWSNADADAFLALREQFVHDPSNDKLLSVVFDRLLAGTAFEMPPRLVHELTRGQGSDTRHWLLQFTSLWSSMSALHLAVFCRRGDVAVHLMERGASIKYEWEGYPPIATAAEFTDSSVVSRLLELGANINAEYAPKSYACTGFTALHFAARTGNVDVVDLLLTRGAKTLSSASWSPLHLATIGGHISAVAALLKGGARPDPSSLHLASKMGSVAIVQLLLEAGADPNLPGVDLRKAEYREEAADPGTPTPIDTYFYNRTPLLDATMEAHIDVVRILLDAGADADFKNSAGRNALSFAKAQKNAQLVALLRPKTKRILGLF